MQFPPIENIRQADDSEYDITFIQNEYGCGLDYYLARIDKLMLCGKRVLDAGCGVGQWSIALAQRFDEVVCIDINEKRLGTFRHVVDMMGLSNIHTQSASIEELPFCDDEFDAVFCYGVIMFTNVEKTLSEFKRVLNPGGKVYVCLNGDGWSQYLIKERGANDPKMVEAGAETLYSTFWARAMQRGLPDFYEMYHFSRSAKIIGRLMNRRDGFLYNIMKANPVWSELRAEIMQKLPADYLERFYSDCRRLINSETETIGFYSARAYQPEEIARILQRLGLFDYQWAPENGIVCDYRFADIAPKYDGYYDKELSVWEFIATKPGGVNIEENMAFHKKLSASAARMQVYINTGETSVISNNRNLYSTMPEGMIAYYKQMADSLGGHTYVEKLAAKIVCDCKTEEDKIKAIYRFVQFAVYRDPVAQPMTESGIPDSILILCAARGRCGHAAKVAVDMCRRAGIEAETVQFPNHVIATASLGGRHVIIDADAFKNGIIPLNQKGQLLSLEDIEENPWLLDNFPASGWMCYDDRTNQRDGVFGKRVVGYADNIPPCEKGYVSGYYHEAAAGFPPSIAGDIRATLAGGRLRITWEPSTVNDGTLQMYRVFVGSRSRNWNYRNLFTRFENVDFYHLPGDIAAVETTDTEIVIPGIKAETVFVSIVAISDRITKNPDTYFWPSEEVLVEAH